MDRAESAQLLGDGITFVERSNELELVEKVLS